MDHFISSEPPHGDVRRAPAADLLALANFEHEAPLSIAETMHDKSWLAGTARHLVALVRTPQALEALDAEPHPLEPLDLEGLDTDDAELAVHLVDLIEDADVALDTEMVTIIRRMVARLAAHPDKPLRRKAKNIRIAGAIVWLALSGSNMVGRRRGMRKAGLIWQAFETSAATDIGHSLAYALRHPGDDEPSDVTDLNDTAFGIVHCPQVNDPALLHSRYRTSLVEQRHDLKARIRDQQRSEMDRHPVQVRPGGRVRFATNPTTIRWAMRSPDENGRDTVMLATGDLRTMELTSISVPDAHRLITALEHALNQPLTAVS